jgi:hypothetical protein
MDIYGASKPASKLVNQKAGNPARQHATYVQFLLVDRIWMTISSGLANRNMSDVPL